MQPVVRRRPFGFWAGSTLGNYWKYCVGDWRIICDIQDRRIVVRVLRIGNRRDIYR